MPGQVLISAIRYSWRWIPAGRVVSTRADSSELKTGYQQVLHRENGNKSYAKRSREFLGLLIKPIDFKSPR